MLPNVTDFEESGPADDPSGDKPTALTHRQTAALPYLVSSSTLKEGAELAGISRMTFYRWMEDDHFRTRFERLREEALSLAHAELKGLTLKGAIALAAMLEDPSPDIRLRAAKAAIAAGAKVYEQTNLQDRLERLSDALDLQRSRKPRF